MPGLMATPVPSKKDRVESESDSESESDLLERLFGRKEGINKQPTLIDSVILPPSDDEDEQIEKLESDDLMVEKIEKPKKVWQDDDDDESEMMIARSKFSQFSSGWSNLKPVVSDEDAFAGKIFSKDSKSLPEKELDFEECGMLGLRGGGAVTSFQFHPQAPAAMVAQADAVTMYQVNRFRGFFQMFQYKLIA
jgi:hypothetical protein